MARKQLGVAASGPDDAINVAFSESGTETLVNKSISGVENTLSDIPVNALAATGTASSATFLNGSGQWATPSAQSGSSTLGPGSVTMEDLDTTGTASATTYLSGAGVWSTPAPAVPGTVGDVPIIGNMGTPLKDSGLAAPASTFVGVSDSQTLTNKTISGTQNNLSAIPVTALSTTGTASSSTFLSGTGEWAPASQVVEFNTTTSSWPSRPATSSPVIWIGGTAPANAPDVNVAGDFWLPESEPTGAAVVTVSPTAPSSPSVGDIWVDTGSS